MESHGEGLPDPGLGPVEWILANVRLRPSSAAEFWYDRMESQSGRRLPVIYEPFDGRNPGHFADRGQILDFASVAGGGRVLDFGPGDGWPALLMAPLADEVVGVDGSRRRVEVCADNARRLGLGDARFVHVPPGQPLPLEDGSFGGATASSSVEQTPDPRATLRELCRVLAPGGRLRMHYESLAYYRGRGERALALGDRGEGPTRLLVFNRRIDEERVLHYGLLVDFSGAEVEEVFSRDGSRPSYAGLTPRVLAELRAHLVDAATWTTLHPSCRTLLGWLVEAGFRSATPTYDGGWLARRLFERLPEPERPVELSAVDRLLWPLVEVVAGMEAPSAARPGEWEPWVTAVK